MGVGGSGWVPEHRGFLGKGNQGKDPHADASYEDPLTAQLGSSSCPCSHFPPVLVPYALLSHGPCWVALPLIFILPGLETQ